MQNDRKNEKNYKQFPDFHIEVDKVSGGISVSVGLVSSVIDISRNYVVLKLKKRKIKIVGEDLSITVYENKIADISGRVCGIEFL